jgi:hypothetical protein
MDGLKQTNKNSSTIADAGTEIDDTLLKSEVYYQYRENISPATTTAVDPTKIALAFTEIQNGATGTRESTYIRSQYAPAE